MHSTTFSVQTEGASLRVRRAEVAGEPALLVHGGPGGTDYLFKFFATPLKNRSYQSISFIQRGSPGSPSDGPFRIQTFVDDIEAVRREIQAPKVTLVGHSWGGLLSTLFAAQHPEKVARLILVCPIGARAGWRGQFNREIERRMTPQELRTYKQLLRDAENASNENERNTLMVRRLQIAYYSYYSPHHREGKPGLAHIEFRVRESIMNQLDALYGNPEWETGLQRLECQAFVIHGLDDPIPETVAQDYAAIIPGAQLLPIPDAGHFAWMEERELFFEALAKAL